MIQRISVALLLIAFLFSCKEDENRILVFSKTAGFRHGSINEGKLALMKLGAENDFKVDTTELAESFTEENLQNYKAVVFLNTTGDVLNQAQQNEFKRFIQAGGGFVGIHAAADTEYEWYWYNRLVGAYFKSHPDQQNAVLKKTGNLPDNKNDTTNSVWTKWDEWYNYQRIQPDLNILYQLDESSYQGGENGANHPIAWWHDFEGGRAFYTGLGHTNESYSDKNFLTHLLQGIQYALDVSSLNYQHLKTQPAIEENRFAKTVLGYYFNEPTEMTILPDGQVLFLERKGNVKLYDPIKDTITVINKFNVYSGNEDGMIGLTKDPHFLTNHWLYIFYSHPDRSSNVLSRFEFKDGKIEMASEIELLEVVVQRDQCCHTGGSLAFDKHGNLLISTGDNTSPFESDGFSPSDERPGRAPFDAQGSSANTADLRGKILRIHPEPDGTYTIPPGNLFAPHDASGKTRPEIYVMGLRNPYRISIDKGTNWLYWGEVGPDAGNSSETRGPHGYDEVNQAKGPGFFGWPYFVGGNFAYADYNFETKEIGPRHDSSKPINNSPNNTGLTELPAVAPPFIYYPYDASPDFPLMKTGGRNAMAGPIYYSTDYKGMKDAFPSYFDGKLFIYDWMRNWIRLVTRDKEGRILDIEPFMDNTKFNNIIDMEFGPDGKLYMLEYGTKWFGENLDARLVRIDYFKANRPPVAKLEVDKVNGALPLTLNFSGASSSDPDGNKLRFELFVEGKTLKSDSGVFDYTFEKSGVFRPKLTVYDAQGFKSSDEVVIVAGNTPPQVSISVEGNATYYFPGSTIKYNVSVEDSEDGSTTAKTIDASKVAFSINFMAQGFDSAQVAKGHQKPAHPGMLLMAESDCKSCHLIDTKSAGPAYLDIAKKYKPQTNAVEVLSDKIIKGGSGVWGNTPMAAHPQITRASASVMVEYILSLANEAPVSTLPLVGNTFFAPAPATGLHPQSAYIFTARYNDGGAGAAPSLDGGASYALKAPMLLSSQAIRSDSLQLGTLQGEPAIQNIRNGSILTFLNVDVEAVKGMDFTILETNETIGGQIEVYLDSLGGKKLGMVDFSKVSKTSIGEGVMLSIGKLKFNRLMDHHSLVLRFTNVKAGITDKLLIFRKIELRDK